MHSDGEKSTSQKDLAINAATKPSAGKRNESNKTYIIISEWFLSSICSYTKNEPKIGKLAACLIPHSVFSQVSTATQTHSSVPLQFDFCAQKFRIRSFLESAVSFRTKNRSSRCPKRGRLVGIDITRTQVLSMCLRLYVFLFCFLFLFFCFSRSSVRSSSICRRTRSYDLFCSAFGRTKWIANWIQRFAGIWMKHT